MMRADGIDVSASSVLRAMRRLDLVLPERHLKERRALAAARKAAFMEVPIRPNQVWQMDFTEFETRCGGTWRICPVVDYVSKYALAAPVTGTATQRDAIAALEAAIATAELMAGMSLAEACTDPESGEIVPLRIVTDNGSAFKSTAFVRFFAARPWLAHIRTRHYSPNQNGVVERFNRTLKYEHLYRLEIDDAPGLMDEVTLFLELYNEVRPHEAIGDLRPVDVHAASHLFRVQSVQES
jgi:transposase InsO family protein